MKTWEFDSWQKFEEFVRDVFESYEFETQFRVVFRDDMGKSEIDVLACRGKLVLAIDAKRYTGGWYRLSAVRREAKKHAERCRRYSKLSGREVIPILVPLIDDGIVSCGGCLIVPMRALRDFLSNIEYYLTLFGYL
jgi:Holliday junction resolvase-like predicted endonuclease